MGVQTCALPIYLAAIVGIDSPLIQFLLARRSDRANHRIIDLGTGEKPGPTRDAVKQAGIDLGQQARPQPVAPIAPPLPTGRIATATRSEEHTSELQSLMRISYAVFCLKKKKHKRVYI